MVLDVSIILIYASLLLQAYAFSNIFVMTLLKDCLAEEKKGHLRSLRN